MKVVFGVVAISAAAGVIVPFAAAGSDVSSWWHAMDGIPILIARPPAGKIRVNNHSVAHPKGVEELAEEEPVARERFLAFGDYFDPTFSCPATITCPDVCVASVEDCPVDAVCPGKDVSKILFMCTYHVCSPSLVANFCYLPPTRTSFAVVVDLMNYPCSCVSTGRAPILQREKHATQRLNRHARARRSRSFARNKWTWNPHALRGSHPNMITT